MTQLHLHVFVVSQEFKIPPYWILWPPGVFEHTIQPACVTMLTRQGKVRECQVLFCDQVHIKTSVPQLLVGDALHAVTHLLDPIHPDGERLCT